MREERNASNGKDTEFFSFNKLKATLSVGIYGSFYGDHKNELIALQDYLKKNGYKNTRISEDLDKRPLSERENPDPSYARYLSEQLIHKSEVHIFVLFLPDTTDPGNLNQSVSMELERLNTLIEYGIKKNQDLIILLQNGLRQKIKGCLGSVCSGLLMKKGDSWDIVDFPTIESTYKAVFHFCYRCIEKRGGNRE